MHMTNLKTLLKYKFYLNLFSAKLLVQCTEACVCMCVYECEWRNFKAKRVRVLKVFRGAKYEL